MEHRRDHIVTLSKFSFLLQRPVVAKRMWSGDRCPLLFNALHNARE